MAQRSAASFKTTKNSRFADNATGQIEEVDHRDMYEDVADSFLNKTDHLIDDDTFATATSSNVASAESTKAYVDAAVSGVFSTCKRTITTAEILSANSSPVQVLAGQGAGNVIQIVSPITVKYTYASAAFATNVTFAFYLDSAGALIITGSDNTTLTQTQNFYSSLTVISRQSTATSIENGGIWFKISAGNPTGGGTSSLKVRFNYIVVTL